MTQDSAASTPPDDWVRARADFDQLALGRFVPPAMGDPLLRRCPTGATSLGVRFAGPWTFRVWSQVPVAELWHWIALATFLDPSTVPVETVIEKHIRRRSAVGLFRDRLFIAAQLVQLGGVDCLTVAADAKRSLVTLEAFTEWAGVVDLPLPEDFPKPLARRAPRVARTTASGPLMRLKEIMPMLPFSPATLWRRVNAGTFPAPIKISSGVTVWRREEVEAWSQAQVLAHEKRPSKKVRSRP